MSNGSGRSWATIPTRSSVVSATRLRKSPACALGRSSDESGSPPPPPSVDSGEGVCEHRRRARRVFARRRAQPGRKEIMFDARQALLALACLGVSVGGNAQTGALERKDVHIAVGGKASLYYLPLTVSEQLGYFKDEGLNLQISDFAG